jgi:hypothetical protein
LKAEEKSSARRQIAKAVDYQNTFRSEHGKRVLNDLVSQHFVMGSTFNGDVQTMAFQEGQRQVVLRILTVLKLDAEKVQNLIRESDEYVRKQNTI